jgi:hypothetical protein
MAGAKKRKARKTEERKMIKQQYKEKESRSKQNPTLSPRILPLDIPKRGATNGGTGD